MTAEEESSALDFASELHPELLSYIMKFRTNTEPFLSRHFDTATDVHPSDWWKLARVPEEISKICRKILARSPSTGSLERLFSTFGWVHSKERNRLGTEKAGKMVFCMKVLNKKNERLLNFSQLTSCSS